MRLYRAYKSPKFIKFKKFKKKIKGAMRHFLREISRKKVKKRGKKARDSDPVNIVECGGIFYFLTLF